MNPTSDDTPRSGFGCIAGGKHNRRGWVTQPVQILTPLYLCLIFCVICCRNTETPVGATDELGATTPTQKVDGFSTQHTEAGVIKWTLVGDTSTFHGSYIEVQNPTVQIFEDGVVSMTVNSRKGKQFLTGSKKNNLHFTGDVVGVSEDGTLYSEVLHWQNLAGKLYGPEEVTLVRGDSTWIGTEMYANPTLRTVKMKNNQFELHPKDEKAHEYHQTPIEPE